MEKNNVYTIWSQNRLQKTLICIDPNDEDQYATLILKASAKMGINGSTLVLESNGTTVDDDVLIHVRNEILIMLEKEQTWTPRNLLSSLSTTSQGSGSLVVSLPSTDTVIAENSEEYANQFLNMDFESAANFEKSSTFGPQVLQENVQNIEIHQIIDCNSENFWLELEVPFDKLSHKEREELSKGVRNSRTRKKLVHLFVMLNKCFPWNWLFYYKNLNLPNIELTVQKYIVHYLINQ
ncbi:unnamed protein product [Phaedon cochleariae]|uniref:CIDE-N domain-containing protein n=1 Tax=Phaedon cochleariae TaxID=80249 RepID=A0A9P0DA97_PHACE|nr:unnamed protein product [Phaedon cochleariae]